MSEFINIDGHNIYIIEDISSEETYQELLELSDDQIDAMIVQFNNH